MTTEQIVELVLLARSDTARWEELKKHELAIEAWHTTAEREGRNDYVNAPRHPTLKALALDVVQRRYGTDEGIDYAVLILGLRYAARVDLGLRADLSGEP